MNKVTYVDYEAILNKGNERGANSIAFTVFDWAIGVNYIHYMEALDGASLYYKKSLFWSRKLPAAGTLSNLTIEAGFRSNQTRQMILL